MRGDRFVRRQGRPAPPERRRQFPGAISDRGRAQLLRDAQAHLQVDARHVLRLDARLQLAERCIGEALDIGFPAQDVRAALQKYPFPVASGGALSPAERQAMSRSWWKKDGPECIERSRGNKASEEAEEAARRAWRALALAGAPRCPKAERATRIADAAVLCDRARAHNTEARYNFGRLTGKVDAAEAERRAGRQQHTNSFDGSTYYHDPPGAKAHEKAGVTSLRPVVRSLSQELWELGECLRKFRGPASARVGGWDSAEVKIATRYAPSGILGEPTPYRHCGWCGEVEEKWRYHIGLDGDGYAVRREDAVRFCCTGCFLAGKDLADPHPKPIDPNVQAVEVRVEGPPALPAHAPELPAHTDDDESPRSATGGASC